MVSTAELTGIALVFMRMTGCILLNPILGSRNFPSLFKAGMVMMMTLMTVSFAPVSVQVQNSVPVLLVLLLKELLVGYCIGFVLHLFSYVIIFGGELIDMQMGISMSKIYDPQSNVSLSLSASFFNITYLMLFFSSNGHLTLLKLMVRSADLVPYGGITIRPELTHYMVDLFCQCTVLAVKLAMPIVAVQFLMEIGVGILMKAIPQINVFVVNIQAKLFVGLLSLCIVYGPMLTFLEKMIQQLFSAVSQTFYLLQ